MSNSSMKVCFLINQLAPGGAPTLLLDLVTHTDADADIDYTICFIEGEDELAPDFKAAGARVVDFGAEFKFDPRAIWRLARFFQHETFDILHIHLPYAQTLGRVFGWLGGNKTIISTQHNVPSERHPITRVLARITRPLDTAIVTVAGGIEREFTGKMHLYDGDLLGRWCTIYNGIDVNAFNQRVHDADPDGFMSRNGIGGDPIFLSVGRYVPAKAQHDLIVAMECVVKELPEATLLMVGWGELEDELRDAVSDHDLENHVTITGRVPGEDVPEYYALADVFVSSSVREGLPIAILEAMAAELPVVATDISGVNEVVLPGETGMVVPPSSPTQLAEAMVQSVNTGPTVGKRGFDRAVGEFDIQKTTTDHIRLYREIVAESTGH